ncbi:hypothetical protein HZH68_000396 [Vespula germanica]|uniref:Uncharacterized protein n=1 Tax=Vespula germanica TaxID=30212 RepID=A0A834NTJ8_VESGE|nr:hypothetical protein HZH68_000396 [Vespula germanica]
MFTRARYRDNTLWSSEKGYASLRMETENGISLSISMKRDSCSILEFYLNNNNNGSSSDNNNDEGYDDDDVDNDDDDNDDDDDGDDDDDNKLFIG